MAKKKIFSLHKKKISFAQEEDLLLAQEDDHLLDQEEDPLFELEEKPLLVQGEDLLLAHSTRGRARVDSGVGRARLVAAALAVWARHLVAQLAAVRLPHSCLPLSRFTQSSFST